MPRKRERRRNGDVDILIAMVLSEMFDLSPPSPGSGAKPASNDERGANGSRSARGAATRRRESRRSAQEPSA